METSKQEALWVLRAQCDDHDALELLLESVEPSVRRYLRRVVGPDEADDVLQEVLILVFRRLKWLANPNLFRPWLFRIASRAAFRHLKKRKHYEEIEIAEDIPAPEPPPSDVLSNLHDIPPGSRAVLVLHFEEELTLPDVAAVLDIPLGTVKSRLAYGLNVLRKKIKGASDV